MRKINSSLEERQYCHVTELAAREGKSISQITRGLVDALSELGEGEIKKDPIFEIIAMGRGEGSSVARAHDNILYRKSQ